MSALSSVPMCDLLVALESGSRPKGGVKGIETGVPSLGGEHLDADGGFRFDRIRFVPPGFAASMRRGRIQVGDILVVKDGATTGKVALVRDSFPYRHAVVNEHVFLCRCGDRVDPRYAFWYLFSADGQRQILSDFRGAAQGGISQRFADLVEIPLRPIDEQSTVVAEIEKQFSRLDEAVSNLKRVKAETTRIVGSILREAIEGRLLPPMEPWRTIQVCEAGDVLLGRQRAPQYLTGRWPQKYLRVANIKDDAIDFSDVETMDFDETHFAKYRLRPGDILISEGQSPELLGQSAIFHGHDEPLCFQKTLHRFRADSSVTTPEFAQIVFRSHVRSGVFRKLGSITTNIGHLTLEKFRAAPFPCPSLPEQHAIATEVDRRLSIVRHVRAAVDANLKRAQALRQAVLARAFSARPMVEIAA